eukprot:gene13411-9603_t
MDDEASSVHAAGLVHDWYAVLAVDERATAEQIKAAYRSKLLAVHPDKVGESASAATELERLLTAFRVLSDADSRAAFDSQRNARQSKGINAGLVSFRQFEETTARDGSRVFTFPCRCGDVFEIAEEDLEEDADFLLQCSGCTLHVQVTTD